MLIWVVNEGDPLPLEGCGGRRMRSGMIAEKLATRGNGVIWWSSTFMHYEKRYFCRSSSTIKITNTLSLKLLHSPNGYKKNICLKRLEYSKDLSRAFKKAIRHQPRPSVIYCSWPLIDFSYECVRFGQKHNIPVVIDIRDTWPDIFVQPFPKPIQPLAKFGVNLLFGRKVSFVMRKAAAIIGVVPKALEFAELKGRKPSPVDQVVLLAYDASPISTEEKEQALQYWSSLGVTSAKFIVLYIGGISNRIGDFDTIVGAARRCTDTDILFVLCGKGDYFETLSTAIKDIDNIILPGYMNRAELQVLLSISKIGLLAYRNTEDFIDSLPTKFGEYLSGGLIILTELKGLSRQVLEENQCGAYYSDGETLLNQIQTIKNDKELAAKMAKNAKKLFFSDFDASNVYEKFCQFLESLGRAS